MKLAIIGCGSRMSNLLKTIKRLDPSMRVVALMDPDAGAVDRLPEDSRADVRRVETVAELMRTNPDAITVGTRCNLHTPSAIAIAGTGLPIFLEKPVSTTMEQAEQLERAFAGSRSQVIVSFPLRLTPVFSKVKSIVQGAAFGHPEHILGVNYVTYGDVYFARWYRDYAVTQGLFLQKATHDLDYLMELAGAPVVRVAAMASKGRVYRDASTKPATGGADAHYYEGIGTPETGMNEDSSSVLMEFANGAQGLYTQVFFSRRRAEARGATISAKAATVSFDWYRGSITTNWHEQPFQDVASVDGTVDHWGGDDVLLGNLIGVATRGEKSLSPLSAGLRSVYTCLAAKASAEQGAFVKVRQLAGTVA